MDTREAAIVDAAKKIKAEKSKNGTKKLVIICGTVVICVLLASLAVLGCFMIQAQQETIREQQYALNMQYASLMEYVAGAEITTETAEADGDGSISVAGDGNTTAGGDVISGE